MTRLRSVLLCATLISLTSPAAYAGNTVGLSGAEKQDFKVVRIGDTDLNCAQLSYEATRMQDIVARQQAAQDDAEMKTRGVQAAGAVGSVILGAATAGIGLGVAGFLASEALDEEADAADSLQDKASERRSFMVGIYNAKGCQGPIEHALIDPEPGDMFTELANIEPAAGETENRTATGNYAFQQQVREEDKNVPSFGQPVKRERRFNN